MEPRRRTDLIILAAGAALSLVLPLAAAAHLGARITQDVEPALSGALGVPVEIARVEAGVMGELRLAGVRVGNVFAADGIEAAVSLKSLLAGVLDADEVRIARPRIEARIDPDGRFDVSRLIERALARRAHRGGGRAPGSHAVRPRQRRIVVTGGDLVVDLGRRGELRVRGLSLHPQRDGLRALATETLIEGHHEHWTVHGRLGRTAADVSLPSADLERLLAVGGEVELEAKLEAKLDARTKANITAETTAAGAPTLALTRVTVGQNIEGRGITLSGEITGTGTPGQVSIHALRGVRVDAVNLPLAVLAPLLPASVDLGRAHASGYLAVETDNGPASRPDADPAPVPAPGSRVGFELDAEVRDVIIEHTHVAAQPMTLSAHSRMHATMDRGRHDRRLDVDELELTMGALTVQLSGHAVYHDGPAGARGRSWLPEAASLRATVPTVACASALGSLPEPLRDRLTGLDLAGEVALGLELEFDHRLISEASSEASSGPPPETAPETGQDTGRGNDSDGNSRATTLDIDLDASRCRVLREAPDADPARIVSTFLHEFPGGSSARIGPGEPDYVRLRELPRYLYQAFVAAEDARFFRHRGFDIHQIERSLAIDLEQGALVRGGSTISQQLVKNVFLSHHRTIARKLQEAVLTWRLEATLGKEQILERYLNIIELGPGVFGVGIAARYWFDKEAKDLTIRECAFLAALTPAPRTMSRRIALSRGVDPETSHRVDVVLRAMRRNGVLGDAAYQRTKGQSLSLRPAALAATPQP